MINENQKIEFNENPKMASLREGFGVGLSELGETDLKVVALCADLTDSTKMDLFKERFPNRFFEVGVAEQNLVTIASGMAGAGKIPFVSSYAVFSPGRNWEQIRTTICLNNQKVVIVGSHAGVSVGPDGATHQALEDIALMRILPNMTVLTPADAEEARKATIASAKIPGPVYLRLSREATSVFTTKQSKFEVGKIQVLLEPENKKAEVAIFASGTVVFESLLAGLEMEKEGIPVLVINVSTIKPLDREIIEIAKNVQAFVSVEEHQIAGGLGSAISELVSQNFPVPIEFVGIKDRFGQSGTADELFKEYNLTKKDIILAVRKVLVRKVG